MAYLIDSDVFIEAKNRHYGFDFCPAFWDWLIQKHAAGDVFSVEKISDELTPANDDLAQWATARGAAFFLAPDAQVIAGLSAATAWATTQQAGNPGQPTFTYMANAQATFASSGDIYLIAHALAYGHTVVTHEQAAATPTRVKIPNACAALGVPCITPFAMLRQAGASFVLPTANASALAAIGVATGMPQAAIPLVQPQPGQQAGT